MTNFEFDHKIKKIKKKYIASPSNQLFHAGVIFLISLIFGLFYFQLEPVPQTVKPEDVARVRLGLGGMLGIMIAVVGMLLYLIWTRWRIHKAEQVAKAEIMNDALKRLNKK